tara:strand:- start:3797 stop:3994 length:198 start_codon:yes stop_codon:yes gene_type:complete
MTIKNEKEILFYKTAIDTMSKLVIYSNLERSKEEALKIAVQYTTDIFEAVEQAYLEKLRRDASTK